MEIEIKQKQTIIKTKLISSDIPYYYYNVEGDENYSIRTYGKIDNGIVNEIIEHQEYRSQKTYYEIFVEKFSELHHD